MSRMKTSLQAGLLVLSVVSPLAAQDALSWRFAACAGRYSAELEHSRLMGAGENLAYLGNRQAFVDLAEAAAQPGAGRALLNQRVDAKQAQARLLHAATFLQDERRANYAKRTAASYIQMCQGLLLDRGLSVPISVTN